MSSKTRSRDTRTTLAPATDRRRHQRPAAGRHASTTTPTPGLRLCDRHRRHRHLAMEWPRRHRPRAAPSRLGTIPHVGLAEARRLARQMGHNVPATGRRPDPRSARGTGTREGADGPHAGRSAAHLWPSRANLAKSWAPQMEPQIKRVFRPHLDTALAALRVGDLQMTIDGYPKPKSASFGVRCLLTVLRWAVAPGRAYVDRDLLGLRASAPKPAAIACCHARNWPSCCRCCKPRTASTPAAIADDPADRRPQGRGGGRAVAGREPHCRHLDVAGDEERHSSMSSRCRGRRARSCGPYSRSRRIPRGWCSPPAGKAPDRLGGRDGTACRRHLPPRGWTKARSYAEQRRRSWAKWA